MKNKKTILFLISFLIIFYVVISIILNLPKGKVYKNTVFIGSSTRISVNGDDIKVYNEDVAVRKQKVKIYYNDSFIDAYIKSDESETGGVKNVLSLYNEDDALIFPNIFVAYTDNLKIKVKDSNKNRGTDLSEVTKFAKENNITLADNVKMDYLILDSLDIDGDGEEENFYSVGLTGSSTYDSIVFMKKNGKYYLIDKIENEIRGANAKRLYYSFLISFDDGDKYNYVINKKMTEYGPTYSELYTFDGTKFTKMGGE